MTKANPYDPAATCDAPPRVTGSTGILCNTFLASAAIVASAPFLGYSVHAARDDQSVAIWIGLAWVAGILMTGAGIITFCVRTPVSALPKITALALILYDVIAAVFGFGGVGHAVRELLAG